MSSLNFQQRDATTHWKPEYIEDQPDRPLSGVNSARFYSEHIFRPPTPSYNSPPKASDYPNEYEAPAWQTVGGEGYDSAAFNETRGSVDSDYFQWHYNPSSDLGAYQGRSASYPQTPYEHHSDREDCYGLTVSPSHLSDASRCSVATIDYPLPQMPAFSAQQQLDLNAHLSSLGRYDPDASAIVDSDHNIRVTDHQITAKLAISDLPSGSFAPMTTIHHAEGSDILPGIVRDDPSKQNITYWIPLDPLTPQRHARISKEAHLRGLHQSSIASMLNLFSNDDGADKCPSTTACAERPECPILEIDLFESRDGNQDEDLRKPVKGKEKIKRPPNSFMIYRRSQTQRAMVNARKLGMKLDHKTISSVIGLLWQTERSAVQDYFVQLSVIEKSRHQMLFPGYRFQPRRKSRGESSAVKVKDLR